MTNEELHQRYYVEFAAEFLRSDISLPDEMTDEDVIRQGLGAEIDIHMFKRSPRRLPRVIKTIGMLRQINPNSILEVGCGPGVFLWTLMDQFPFISIRAEDSNIYHIDRIGKVIRRKFHNFSCGVIDLEMESTWTDYSRTFDIVTCLEVLEHISNWKKAVQYICDSSKKFIIVSFPSKLDSNPGHIHFFDKDEVVEEIMKQRKIISTKFDYVNGHTFVIAKKEL